MLPAKVNKGELPKAETTNAIIDELKRLGNWTAGKGLSVSKGVNGFKVWLNEAESVRIGMIVNCGQCASSTCSCADDDASCTGCCESFTDERYWVVRCYIDLLETDACDAAITLTPYDATDYRYEKVCVTNVPEILGGTHLLPNGSYVIYDYEYDNGSPPTRRYYMEESIGGGAGVGQYEGMVYGDITTNQGGFFFPSATPMTGSGS